MKFFIKIHAKYAVREQESDAVRTYKQKWAEEDADDPDNYSPRGMKFVKELPAIRDFHVYLYESIPFKTRKKPVHEGPDILKFLFSHSSNHEDDGVVTLQLGRIPPYDKTLWAVKFVGIKKDVDEAGQPKYRGKGLAPAIYKAALRHVGELFSDVLVSDAAKKVWLKLADDPAVKVELAKSKIDRHRAAM